MPADDGEEHVYPTGFNYKNGHHGSTSDTEVGFYTDPDAPATRKSYPGIIKAGFIYNGSKVGSTSIFTGPGGFPDYKAGKFVDHNYTFYFQGNQPLYRVAAGSNRGLDVTFGFNVGPQNKSEVPTEFTGGLIFNGPLPGRAKDGLAFGFVYSKIGNDFNNFLRASLLPTLSDEKEFEVNYKAQLTPWLLLQPVYQYYANVGGLNKGAAGIAGFRLVTTF
jgi:carbohydrate-selective porin OprB